MQSVVLDVTRPLQKRGPAAEIVLTDEEVAMFGAGKVSPVILSLAVGDSGGALAPAFGERSVSSA